MLDPLKHIDCGRALPPQFVKRCSDSLNRSSIHSIECRSRADSRMNGCVKAHQVTMVLCHIQRHYVICSLASSHGIFESASRKRCESDGAELPLNDGNQGCRIYDVNARSRHPQGVDWKTVLVSRASSQHPVSQQSSGELYKPQPLVDVSLVSDHGDDRTQEWYGSFDCSRFLSILCKSE